MISGYGHHSGRLDIRLKTLVYVANPSQVNTTLHISPSTDEPMLYLDNGSPCPLNPDERASSVIRVSTVLPSIVHP